MWYDVGNLNVYIFRNFVDISAEIPWDKAYTFNGFPLGGDRLALA